MTYSDFLTANAGKISSIESSLRSLTWFLPGRFQDAELASEALYSALNVLGLYHDRILTRAANVLPRHLKPQLSSHARYTAFWYDLSPAYRRSATLLSTLSYAELLIEMAAKRRWGSDKRWRVVLYLECLKAALKLSLVSTTGRPTVQPAVAEREFNPELLDQKRATNGMSGRASPSTDSPDGSAERPSHDHWRGARTGLERPTIASLRARSQSPLVEAGNNVQPGSPTADGRQQVNDYLLSKILTVEEIRKPDDLVRRLDSAKAAVAELIYIFRPVVYVLALRRYGTRHTAPFLLSLTLEYLARSLRQPNASQRLSDVERRELTRRQRAFWWYFLRGPVWDGWTKPQLESLTRLLDGKPLLGLLSTVIRDYTPLIDSYFYYSN